MQTERFTGGFVQTNGYLIQVDDGWHVVVDAPAGMAAWLKQKGIVPAALLLTHQHYDHVEDAAAIAHEGVPVYAFAPWSPSLTLETLMQEFGMPVNVEPFTVNEVLEGQNELELLGQRFVLAHVPGHSPDSLTYYLPDRGELFAGDTLFAGSVGRADLPGGDPDLLISGIREKIFALPPETVVYPGHGPETTTGSERTENPYCGC